MRRHAKASFAGSTLGSGMRRGRLGLICLCVLGLAAFLGSSAPSASAQACPNEAFRHGPVRKPPRLPRLRDGLAGRKGRPGRRRHGTIGYIYAPSHPRAERLLTATARFGRTIRPTALASDYLSRRARADGAPKRISPPIDPSSPFITNRLKSRLHRQTSNRGDPGPLGNRP